MLRKDGTYPGLYATGISTASVMGRAYPGAGSSIGPSFTFGFVAAEHALGNAEAAKSSDSAQPVRSEALPA